MPRTYKRKDDVRKYGYLSETMTNAIKDVTENVMSMQKAAFCMVSTAPPLCTISKVTTAAQLANQLV